MAKTLIELCFCFALEDLMREHMYCELSGKKNQNQVPAPLTFFSPQQTISGKKAFGIVHRNKNVCYGMGWKTSRILCAQTSVCR